MIVVLLTSCALMAGPSEKSTTSQKASDRYWTVPPAVDGIPQAPIPNADALWADDLLPTVIKRKGTWYPYPSDEAQVDQNLYCNRLPELCKEAVDRLANEYEADKFWSNLKSFGWGALTGAAVVGIVAGTLWLTNQRTLR